MIDKEIRQELQQMLENEFVAHGTLTLLHFVLHKDGLSTAEDLKTRAREQAEKVIKTFIATVDAGKVVGR